MIIPYDDKIKKILEPMVKERENEEKTYDDLLDDMTEADKGLIRREISRCATPIGWKCPVCGRGNSPMTGTCPCIPMPPPTITF